MRVLVCGDRNWSDRDLMHMKLAETLVEGDVLIHGDCRGADRMAGRVAGELGCEVEAYPADWDRHGKAAGPIRNKQMLEEGSPDEVWAFHDNFGESRGTKSMVLQAIDAGVTTRFFPSGVSGEEALSRYHTEQGDD